MRSASAIGTWDKSRPPPKALARTPSTSTSVKSDSPPRGKIEVTVPGPPVRATAKPGTSRNASPRVVICRASRSARVMTLTLVPESESGVSICAPVTTRDSTTARMASRISRSARPASTLRGAASMPGAEARSVTGPAGTSRANRPSAPVTTVTGAASGPLTVTEAPAIGWPSGPMTRPPSGWAAAVTAVAHKASAASAWRSPRTLDCDGIVLTDDRCTPYMSPSSAFSAPVPSAGMAGRLKDVGPRRRSPDLRNGARRPRLPPVRRPRPLSEVTDRLLPVCGRTLSAYSGGTVWGLHPASLASHGIASIAEKV